MRKYSPAPTRRSIGGCVCCACKAANLHLYGSRKTNTTVILLYMCRDKSRGCFRKHRGRCRRKTQLLSHRELLPGLCDEGRIKAHKRQIASKSAIYCYVRIVQQRNAKQERNKQKTERWGEAQKSLPTSLCVCIHKTSHPSHTHTKVAPQGVSTFNNTQVLSFAPFS